VIEDRFASFREATAAALLRGPATTPRELRQAVAAGIPPADLAALVDKIRRHAYQVTDSDLDALRGRPVMRGPSELSVGERELFAAFVSRLNQCDF
jgi:hypothetical protein